MWYEDTPLVVPVSKAELTRKQFVNLKKSGKMSFSLYQKYYPPYPPAWYAHLCYHLPHEGSYFIGSYDYVYDPGREVWRRLAV